jgi:hypothetical protein
MNHFQEAAHVREELEAIRTRVAESQAALSLQEKAAMQLRVEAQEAKEAVNTIKASLTHAQVCLHCQSSFTCSVFKAVVFYSWQAEKEALLASERRLTDECARLTAQHGIPPFCSILFFNSLTQVLISYFCVEHRASRAFAVTTAIDAVAIGAPRRGEYEARCRRAQSSSTRYGWSFIVL